MDIRVIQTKKAIRDSFFEMLERRDLGKITVKEICALAEINRATFYKYYDNCYDLLDSLEDEVLENLIADIHKIENIKLHDVFKTVFTDIKRNENVYRVLFSENGDDSFRAKLFNVCYDENMKLIENYFPDLSKSEQEFMYYFIAEGCNGILNQWINTGMSMPIDEVIGFMDMLIESMNAMNMRRA